MVEDLKRDAQSARSYLATQAAVSNWRRLYDVADLIAALVDEIERLEADPQDVNKRLELAVKHVLKKGKVGKQSKRRLKDALR